MVNAGGRPSTTGHPSGVNKTGDMPVFGVLLGAGTGPLTGRRGGSIWYEQAEERTAWTATMWAESLKVAGLTAVGR